MSMDTGETPGTVPGACDKRMGTMKHFRRIVKSYLRRNLFSFTGSIFLCVFAALLAMLPAKLIQLIIDDGFLKKDMPMLIKLILALAFTYLFKYAFTYFSNKLLIYLGNGLLKEVKAGIYDQLMTMDLSFYTGNDVGYINARVEEVSAIDALFSTQSLSLVSALLEFIFALVILLSLSWKILLMLLIPVPILIFAVVLVSGKLNKQVKEALNHSAEYAGKVQDTLRGMETVKSQGLEDVEKEKIDNYNRTALDSQKKQSNTINGFSVGMGSVSSILTVIIYLIGGIYFIKGEVTMGSFVALSNYAGKLYAPILSYAGTAVILQPAITALKRVSDFFFSDSKHPAAGVKKNLGSIQQIEYSNIAFSYSDQTDLIHGFNMRIGKGERVQLVGRNGSGKSTLIRMLLQLVKPNEGTVSINGVSLDDIEHSSLISCVSYVSQHSYVFNESVEKNIFYGVEAPHADSRYRQIIEGLGLDTVIDRLASEGDERIGENGSRLSGGEIQKICIARALLLNRDMFIFDEATSNLDADAIAYLIDTVKASDATWLIVDHQNDFGDLGFRKVFI